MGGENEPFAPLEDDPLLQYADEQNDENRTDLRGFMPPPISGGASMSNLFGGPATADYAPMATGGRPTSPPIWNSAHLHETVSQLRVWKRLNGRPVLVGECDARITTEEFVRRFFAVMPTIGEGEATYVIRPLNYSGIEVGSETELPAISEHHTVLQAERNRRAGSAAQGPYGMGFQQITAPTIDLSPITAATERLNTVYEARIAQLEATANADRERAMNLQEKVSEERAELASRTGRSVEAITERLMGEEATRSQRAAEFEAQRNNASQTAMAQMFSQMASMQQLSAEREREAYDRRLRDESDRRDREQRDAESRRERERAEAENRRLADQNEWERKWAREKEDARLREEAERRRADAERGDREARERAAEANRQQSHERALKEMELSMAREREHAERMIRLHTDREKGESVDGILNKGIGLLDKFGMKPNDLLDIIRPRGEEGPNPLVEIGARVLGDAVKTIGEVVKAKSLNEATTAQAASQAASDTAAMQAGGGMGLMPGMGMPMLPGPGVPAMYPYGAVNQPPPGYAYAQTAPGAPPMLVPAQAAPPPSPEETPTPGCTLPMPQQKAARNAIRALVRTLRTTDESGWGIAVAAAVQTEMAIYHYCEQVSIRVAMQEAGADPAFANRIVDAIDATGLVPANVPRG